MKALFVGGGILLIGVSTLLFLRARSIKETPPPANWRPVQEIRMPWKP